MNTRISSKQKSSMVLSLLRGELIEEVARQNKVTVSDLTLSKNKFLEGGERSLIRNNNDPKIAEYEMTIGKLQMANELLKKKYCFQVQKARDLIELLKKEISPSIGKKYPVDLILKIVGLSSAAWYKKKFPVNKPAKRGPKPPVSDEIVLEHIRKIIAEGSFHGEGYEKIHKRVRKYIKVGKNRVYKLLK